MKSTKEVIPPCRYRNKDTKQNRKAGKIRGVLYQFHAGSVLSDEDKQQKGERPKRRASVTYEW